MRRLNGRDREAIGAIGELIGAIAPYQVVACGQCNDDKANTKQDHWLDLGRIQYDDFAGMLIRFSSVTTTSCVLVVP